LKTIAEISPLPKSGNLQRKRKRTNTSVTILIYSPYENALEEKKGPNMWRKIKIMNLNTKDGVLKIV
jgi:hypothetical protein